MRKGIMLLFVISLFMLMLVVTGCSTKNEKNENSGNTMEQQESGGKSESGNTGAQDRIQYEDSKLDFSFLKLENQKVNKIYSPLSIKYALKMLEEATSGKAKLQISEVVGSQTLTRYSSNQNISLANAFWIRDSFKESVKATYQNTLKEKYGAEVQFDSFATPEKVNSWVSEKTLYLIQNLLEEIDETQNFLLINALGIDLEWKNKFLSTHWEGCSYEHENFGWSSPEQVSSHSFGEEEQMVSGMEIVASVNNYDIMTELGEESIRKTVGNAYKDWARSLTEEDWEFQSEFQGDLSEENIEKNLKAYLEGGTIDGNYTRRGYLSELDSNYKRVDFSTDFSFYVDDEIKVFAKDLKESDGITLQYVGVMPLREELEEYISKMEDATLHQIVDSLKELTPENFKEGVVTEITGYIPKFNFEYNLNLKEDLKQLGVTDVFERGKANLTELSDREGIYIADAIHKANIEFTQDGIKAAAATIFGGAGAGSSFDYIYEIPVEKVDLTFDRPYLFFIREKETGELWFVGTVYEPLSWEEEPERMNTWF